MNTLQYIFGYISCPTEAYEYMTFGGIPVELLS